MNNQISFENYRENIVYEIISSGTQSFKILDPLLNDIPANWEDQIQSLGRKDFNPSKHLEIRKEVKDRVNRLLTDNDRFYILAQSIGIIHKTSYPFKDYPSVKHRSRLTLRFSIANKQNHKNQIDQLIKVYQLYKPLGFKTKKLYDFFTNTISQERRNSKNTLDSTKDYDPFDDFF